MFITWGRSLAWHGDRIDHMITAKGSSGSTSFTDEKDDVQFGAVVTRVSPVQLRSAPPFYFYFREQL